ncbi:hypothetical protein [Lysobacter sp. F6437]|uniref:hypothetical protein n=1 Tax=Lysobacter sp. F6437 TaxID=3459296 RepID=UPI00403DC950
MNRKLHNTLSALTASGALLVVSLIVAAPVPGHADARAAASLAVELDAAGTLAQALETAAQTLESGGADESRPAGASTPNRRQTLVMPFFSFLPRG